MHLRFFWLLPLVILLPVAAAALGQDESGELPRVLPGLVAEYQWADHKTVRIDEDILFVGSSTATDDRLPSQPFRARWTGELLTRENGHFSLSFFAAGRVRLRLDGAELLDEISSEARWHKVPPIDLQFGSHEIVVEYECFNQRPAIGMFWSGPSFELEPITGRYLTHSRLSTVVPDHAQGRALSRGLRCAACHTFRNSEALLAAPSLQSLAGNLHRHWLVERLTESSAPGPIDGAMPDFNLPLDEARAIAAALMAASKPAVETPNVADMLVEKSRAASKQAPPVRVTADAGQGRLTFVSKGCLACHPIGDLGTPEHRHQQLFSGGDLSHIAHKRTAAFFARWLADPALVNPQHRMPLFELTLNERYDLAAFLSSLGEVGSDVFTERDDAALGVQLIARYRCGACHQLPESLTHEIVQTAIDTTSQWDTGCLVEPQPERAVPGFALPREQRAALKACLTSPLMNNASADRLLAENNCLACHARGLELGFARHFPELTNVMPELAALLAAVAPPSLSSIGDKLHEPALRAALSGSEPPRRPWLEIQMPKFNLSEEQVTSLANHLISRDRIPDVSAAASPPPSDKATELAAGRLVTAEGFGCQSCHQIGRGEAPQVALNAHGTDLSLLGQRIRRPWFERWVRNPVRIVPRMEMPAIQTAVPGVLDDSLQLQLAALWQTLNTPDFRPPTPNPVRIIRNHNDPLASDTAHVLTDVLEMSGARFLRPLVVGLPNRHNLLFDLERGHLTGWWIGDTARQYTRGKSWYWEAGAPAVTEHLAFLERMLLLDEMGQEWVPTMVGQVAVELDSISHTPTGAKWSGRLHLSAGKSIREIGLSQTFDVDANAVVVQTRVTGLEPGQRVLIESSGKLGGNDQKRWAQWGAEAQVQFSSAGAQFLLHDAARIRLEPRATDTRAVEWTSRFTTTLPEDRFPPQPLAAFPALPEVLDCVPGYSAIKLPLPTSEMPIAFAWGPNTELYMGSLKGRVLRVGDSDADGLEDSYQLISDEIPTPYGLHFGPAGLDVLAKFALLRLTPPTRAGLVWDATVIADGWGYTADYHDWAVGLELGTQGNYYMALPCQQDDRSEAAARWRGHVLELIPNPESESPRRYRVESFAAGLRFPMGLALSGSGELFASDNQGNYNPFNELNHVQLGKRYGFINKLENKDGFSPPFEAPAIDLPHPWTRSVNGICFLNTPAAMTKQQERPLFGAFEGHLVGCEMNGQSLIRMSLQLVGESYQGAAYLFSRPVTAEEPNFEGPIVCKVSPAGDLYVGNLRDSGWGGGQNTGSIVRLRPAGTLPLGIAEVRATPAGFEIDFTAAIDPDQAADRKNYSLRSYRRISTPAYGGDDQDERLEEIQSITVAENGRQVQLRLKELRAGCVYEINVSSLGATDASWFPSQAHYTMRSIPQ